MTKIKVVPYFMCDRIEPTDTAIEILHLSPIDSHAIAIDISFAKKEPARTDVQVLHKPHIDGQWIGMLSISRNVQVGDRRDSQHRRIVHLDRRQPNGSDTCLGIDFFRFRLEHRHRGRIKTKIVTDLNRLHRKPAVNLSLSRARNQHEKEAQRCDDWHPVAGDGREINSAPLSRHRLWGDLWRV